MKKIFSLIVIAIAALLMLYMGMPVIAYGFLGLPAMIAALTILWIALNMQVIPQMNAGVQTFKVKPNSKVPVVILVILLLYSTVLPMVTSWPLLRTSDYRNLIGKIDETNFVENKIPNADIRLTDNSRLHPHFFLWM